MFDEEKVKKDLERMRKLYEEAIKDLDKAEAIQKQVAEMLERSTKKSNSSNEE